MTNPVVENAKIANAKKRSAEMLALREQAEADFLSFVRLVLPSQVLGGMHEEIANFWTRQGHKSHQLCLTPRDHGKSRMIALRLIWELTKDPTLTFLYVSATIGLALQQLKFVKDILESPRYLYFWPEMIHPDEHKRTKWTEDTVVVDHPARKEALIRDPSILAVGLKANVTGFHFDRGLFDDIVINSNAYSINGRRTLESQVSYLSSVLHVDSEVWAVGTRYHPDDYYSKMMEMAYEIFDKAGNVVGREPLYEILERTVEDSGMGIGQFLWPRAKTPEGRWFGFDRNTLSIKRAQYTNAAAFRSQYYNDPSDTDNGIATRELFNYYDKRHINQKNGNVYMGRDLLNVVFAIDFAYTLGHKSDFTTIAVVGVDAHHNYYVLDLDRFKTDRIADYFEHLFQMHTKWGVRKLRAEATAAQSVIVKDLKENWFKSKGLSIQVDEFKPSASMGTKLERVANVLQPKYEEGRMYHYHGGNNDLLEMEILDAKSSHDDLKDVVASAVDFAKPPSKHNPFAKLRSEDEPSTTTMITARRSRFGGAARKFNNYGS
jgi:hypothetical protein